LAIEQYHAVLDFPVADRGAGLDRHDQPHFGHGGVHAGGTQSGFRAWANRSPMSSSWYSKKSSSRPMQMDFYSG
jgi:hypothetical protein